MVKHPAADDPMLQDKIDKICKYPDEWAIQVQLDRSKDNLEYNKRYIRALEKDISRTEEMIRALELALLNIVELKKEAMNDD